MHLTSVNIGKENNLRIGTILETTGILKKPTVEPVVVLPLGLQDDFICDFKNHGGPDQAVYVYGVVDYDWWSKDLGRELEPGTFGENLTISELESAGFSIGDRLHIGPVILEISAPRIPCKTLAARMGDPGFVKRYRYAERPGLYCRVILPGTIQVGESVSVEKFQGPTLSVLEMFRNYYENNKSETMLRRQLNAPIAIRSRVDLVRDLQKLLEQN